MKSDKFLRRFQTITISLLMLASASCDKGVTDAEAEPCDPGQEALIQDYGRPVIVTAGAEQQPETKTGLSGSQVLWHSGDKFNVLYRRESGENVPLAVNLLSYSALNSMTVGQTKTVMITSVSKDGCKLGVSTSATWSVSKHSGYKNYGEKITDSQASANETKLNGEMLSLAGRADAAKYLFTIKRTSSGFAISSNNCNKYLKGAGDKKEVVFDNSEFSFKLGQRLGYSATTIFVKQNSDNNVVRNPNTVQFYYTSGGSDLYFRIQKNGSPQTGTDNSGYSFFYVYEVTGGSQSSVESYNREYTLSSGAGTARGSFSGLYEDGFDDYVAVYPYNQSNSFDGETLRFQVPATQNYAADSFGEGALPMVGLMDEEMDIDFKNLFGFLELSLKGNHTVTSISVKDASGKSLWGNASLSLSDFKNGDFSCSVSGGSDTVTLGCGSGVALNTETATDFYIAVPAGSFDRGFTVTVSTVAGNISKSTSVDNSIHRNTVLSMPAITLGEIVTPTTVLRIENPVVAAYVDEAHYTDELLRSYTSLWKTLGYESKEKAVSYRTDQPSKFEIEWTSSSTSDLDVVFYSDAACTQVTGDCSAVAYSGKLSLTNFVPGRTYYFRVYSGDTIVRNGVLSAEGKVRMIVADSAFNIRDIGGWGALGGKTMPYGLIYRGGNFDKLTSADGRLLYDLGLRAELELRGCDADGSAAMYHINYRQANPPLVTKIWNGNNDVAYLQNVSDYGADNIMDTQSGHKGDAYIRNTAFIIDCVLHDKPVYFHCLSGADRTGVGAFFIEALLGYYYGDIVEEYEITSFNKEDSEVISSTRHGRPYEYDCRLRRAYSAIMSMSVPSGVTTLQQRVYYYLNHYWSGSRINASDLDAFIKKALGMTEAEYSAYRPSYSDKYEESSNTLSSIYAK